MRMDLASTRNEVRDIAQQECSRAAAAAVADAALTLVPPRPRLAARAGGPPEDPYGSPRSSREGLPRPPRTPSERARAAVDNVPATPAFPGPPARTKPFGKPPTYAGNDNIRGFFRMFECWCEAGVMTDMDKVAQLCSALQDDARDFVQSLSSLDTMTYQELKTQLIDTFGAREAEHLNKLWSFKRGSMSLDDYVTKFRKLRNQAALTKEREDLQVQFFLQGLGPERLRVACLTHGPRTLQAAVDIATRLEPTLGERRVRCLDCNTWYEPGTRHVCPRRDHRDSRD